MRRARLAVRHNSRQTKRAYALVWRLKTPRNILENMCSFEHRVRVKCTNSTDGLWTPDSHKWLEPALDCLVDCLGMQAAAIAARIVMSEPERAWQLRRAARLEIMRALVHCTRATQHERATAARMMAARLSLSFCLYPYW